MSELLARAFAALGPAPTDRELALVADAVRNSGDEQAIAALDADYDDPASKELDAVAIESGASAFVALDLKTVFCTGVGTLVRAKNGPDEGGTGEDPPVRTTYAPAARANPGDGHVPLPALRRPPPCRSVRSALAPRPAAFPAGRSAANRGRLSSGANRAGFEPCEGVYGVRQRSRRGTSDRLEHGRQNA